jgi:hypothetical protein
MARPIRASGATGADAPPDPEALEAQSSGHAGVVRDAYRAAIASARPSSRASSRPRADRIRRRHVAALDLDGDGAVDLAVWEARAGGLVTSTARPNRRSLLSPFANIGGRWHVLGTDQLGPG